MVAVVSVPPEYQLQGESDKQCVAVKNISSEAAQVPVVTQFVIPDSKSSSNNTVRQFNGILISIHPPDPSGACPCKSHGPAVLLPPLNTILSVDATSTSGFNP